MDFVKVIARLYNRPTKCVGDRYFNLPINEVDGVKCNCKLIINEKKSMVTFHIESRFVLEECYEDFHNVTLYNSVYTLPYEQVDEKWTYIYPKNGIEKEPKFIEYCKKLKNDLPKLKLDLNGDLVTDSSNDDDLLAFIECFKDAGNLTLNKPVECCVCTNITLTKTHCKHPLCYRCWFSIPIKDEHGDEPSIDCPLCRANIRATNVAYDSDDEDN